MKNSSLFSLCLNQDFQNFKIFRRRTAYLGRSQDIFYIAPQHQASGIILVHNHPSGNLKPSQLDISLTKKLSQAGPLLDIQIFDHLIIGDTGYYFLEMKACFDFRFTNYDFRFYWNFLIRPSNRNS